MIIIDFVLFFGILHDKTKYEKMIVLLTFFSFLNIFRNQTYLGFRVYPFSSVERFNLLLLFPLKVQLK